MASAFSWAGVVCGLWSDRRFQEAMQVAAGACRSRCAASTREACVCPRARSAHVAPGGGAVRCKRVQRAAGERTEARTPAAARMARTAQRTGVQVGERANVMGVGPRGPNTSASGVSAISLGPAASLGRHGVERVRAAAAHVGAPVEGGDVVREGPVLDGAVLGTDMSGQAGIQLRQGRRS